MVITNTARRDVNQPDSAPAVGRDRALESVRALLRETPPGEAVSLLPWIGWAELDLAGDAADIPSEIALRDVRSMVWRHQLQPADVGEDGRDLVGGVVFTRGRAPLPSWQTMRPLAFLATMFGDDRLTDAADVPDEATRPLASLRFVMQLAVGDAEMHMFRDRARALGGVRLAPWDQRQTLEASSLALLTLSEAIHAAARRAPAAQPAPDAR